MQNLLEIHRSSIYPEKHRSTTNIVARKSLGEVERAFLPERGSLKRSLLEANVFVAAAYLELVWNVYNDTLLAFPPQRLLGKDSSVSS